MTCTITRSGASQGRFPGDVSPRMDVELLEDAGDVGADGPRGHHQPVGDLRIGQALRDERGHVDLGWREAIPAATRPPVADPRAAPDAAAAELGQEPGKVPGRAEGVIDIRGLGERGPRLVAIADIGELPSCRL